MAEEKGQEKGQENQPGKCPGKTPGENAPERTAAGVSVASVEDVFALAVELIRASKGADAKVTMIVRTPRPGAPSAATILSTDDNLQGLMASTQFVLERGTTCDGLTAH